MSHASLHFWTGGLIFLFLLINVIVGKGSKSESKLAPACTSEFILLTALTMIDRTQDAEVEHNEAPELIGFEVHPKTALGRDLEFLVGHEINLFSKTIPGLTANRCGLSACASSCCGSYASSTHH